MIPPLGAGTAAAGAASSSRLAEAWKLAFPGMAQDGAFLEEELATALRTAEEVAARNMLINFRYW